MKRFLLSVIGKGPTKSKAMRWNGSSIGGILISGARGALPFAEPIWQSGQDL